MAFDLKSYLLGKQDKPLVGAYDLPSWLMGKAQSGDTKTLTGVPPLRFVSNGSNLVDWSISGAAGGVGDRTKNIFEIIPSELVVQGADSMEYEINAKSGSITISGTTSDSQFILKQRISVTAELAGRYYFSASFNQISPYNTFRAYLYNQGRGWTTKWDDTTRSPAITGSEYQEVLLVEGFVVEVTLNVYVNKSVNNVIFKPMLRAADTSADFEPYGYKIPVTCGGVTTTIYTQSQLMDGDVLTLADTGVDIPTTDGSNTLTVGTTVQPSSMTITYKKG